MTKYAKYMQRIHNQAMASSIEMGVLLFTEDVLELLVKSGCKGDSQLIEKVKNLQKYEYRNGLQNSNTKP